jgi:pyruvate,water dikinase
MRHYVLTFDKLLSNTSFVNDMREMLSALREAYGCHVDVEFTANFLSDGTYKINLVQCRPLQIEENISIDEPAPAVNGEDMIMEVHGGIIGQSRNLFIDRLIYVEPSVYGHLPESDRYAVARLIGKLTHLEEAGKPKTIMLIGPGRWGTSTPSLGVPVSFAEINTVSVLCEMDSMHESLIPDLSLGTHFFNDLVEMNMLYMGFFGTNPRNSINREFLSQSQNRLEDLLPNASALSQAVRVIDIGAGRRMVLSADTMNQNAFVYVE